MFAQAKAAYDYAASTYERMKPLYADGAVSASDFEGIEAKYLAAKAVYETALNGARPEDIAQAQGAVQQYQATVKQAERRENRERTWLPVRVTPPSGMEITPPPSLRLASPNQLEGAPVRSAPG